MDCTVYCKKTKQNKNKEKIYDDDEFPTSEKPNYLCLPFSSPPPLTQHTPVLSLSLGPDCNLTHSYTHTTQNTVSCSDILFIYHFNPDPDVFPVVPFDIKIKSHH